MKKLTHILFILDKSGSMDDLTDDTIGGFNSYLKKQREEADNDSIVSLYLFDHEVEKIFESVSIENVKNLTRKEYVAGGMTALYDAVGIAIANTKKVNDYLNVAGTLCVIITDGYENSSKEYSYKRIKKLIEKKKTEGWQFIFLGANINAEDVAESIGIDRGNSATFAINEGAFERNFERVHRISNIHRRRVRNSEKLDVSEIDEILEETRREK